MSQVDLRHIRARMQRSTSPDIPTSGPVYKPFHPYAKIAPDALTRAEKRRKIARRKAERHPDPLPTLPPSLPRVSSHCKDASDTSAKPLLAIEDTAKEAHALPISPTKWFLSSPAGALAGFFNRVTRGVLGENVAPNKASTNASLRECHEGNNSEVTGRKRGHKEGEKDSKDDDADGGNKTEDLISLEAGSEYTADMDCDSDAMEEDGGYVQNSPRAESRKGFIPSADDRVDVEWERANDDGEDLRGVVSSAGGEDGKGVSNIGIHTMDDQATERFDFAAGDSNGIGFDDDKEKEEKGDGGSMDMHSDSNADSCRVVSKEGVGEDWEEAPPNVSIHITDDQVAEQSDFALGDSTRAALNEGEEMEEEDSSSDPRLDTDSNSDSSDSDDSSMSDDDMLGNTFQLTDVEVSLGLALVR
ncbi:hypothetical protein PISMIDRAFT_18441 [Pisolithus microcarpus 441]|uniref:Uncharacterized protein n=1 Tax=Pisolithus microcarpus 441 TaxID=765257 RepID=A0A0C9XKG7_9AGAM|nr:hypothetical protein PISMIDRAFT_18441 [Pisolithus microcarpus 441]